MPRVGRGIRGIQNRDATIAAATAKGAEIKEMEMTKMTEQLGDFKTKLQAFAIKHKKDIQKDPEFRGDFQRMCDVIGVDALASQKGFWAELFGMGDFYYKLGVQVADVCLATRGTNGGIMPLTELMNKLVERRPDQLKKLGIDDVERAVAKLRVLGKGFEIINTGKEKLVQSVPTELNQDHTKVLGFVAANRGHTTTDEIAKEMHWDEERAYNALEQMVHEGMAWIDVNPTNSSLLGYWFPGMMKL